MTWTYDDSIPSLTDQVRLMIGDVFDTDPLLSDEGIEFFLIANADNLNATAAQAARAIAGRYAREVGRTVGALSIQAQTRYDHYQDMAEKFEALRGGRSTVAGPVVTGLSVPGREIYTQDPDRTQPAFRRRQHDRVRDSIPRNGDY